MQLSCGGFQSVPKPVAHDFPSGSPPHRRDVSNGGFLSGFCCRDQNRWQEPDLKPSMLQTSVHICTLLFCLSNRNTYWATLRIRAAPWTSTSFWMKAQLKSGMEGSAAGMLQVLFSLQNWCCLPGILPSLSPSPAGRPWLWSLVIASTMKYQISSTRWGDQNDTLLFSCMKPRVTTPPPHLTPPHPPSSLHQMVAALQKKFLEESYPSANHIHIKGADRRRIHTQPSAIIQHLRRLVNQRQAKQQSQWPRASAWRRPRRSNHPICLKHSGNDWSYRFTSPSSDLFRLSTLSGEQGSSRSRLEQIFCRAPLHRKLFNWK